MAINLRGKNIRWWRIVSALGALVFIALGASLWLNVWLLRRAAGQIYTEVQALPYNDVALVLGTSARTRGGYENLHFRHRIEAAAIAYRSGKIRHLILSGDNGQKEYDEPSDMKAALLARGVPEHALTLDYAGFRTLDSLARAKGVFGQSRLTIISDDFHLPRALFLAQHYHIAAVGLASAPVPEIYAHKTQ